MIVWDVIRGEGLSSAFRRAQERLGEAVERVPFERSPILNVADPTLAARTGGVAVQHRTRMRVERALRPIALLEPRAGVAFDEQVRRAMDRAGATAVHLEGMSSIPFEDTLRLMDSAIPVIAGVHDYALFCERPNLIEQRANRFCFYSRDEERCIRCRGSQLHRRELGREILRRAVAVTMPSPFLAGVHRDLFGVDFNEVIIESAVPSTPPRVRDERTAVAFAGNVRTHKGGHLLAEIARGRAMHVFGGGDPALLRALRRMPGVAVHGYYRAGTLATLLARHGIGLVVLPSLFAETYSIVMSEAWMAGAHVAAFDFGAPAERIRRNGGGWLAPLDSGAAGLAAIVDTWLKNPVPLAPRIVQTPRNAALQHLELYRRLGILQS